MKIQCKVCGNYYAMITERHVGQHGLTLEEYKKKYGCVDPREVKSEAMDLFSEKELLDLVQSLDSDSLSKVLTQANVKVLNKKVGEYATYQSVLLVEQRLKSYKASAQNYNSIMDQLMQRVHDNMNPDGSPLSTKDLVSIASLMQQDMTLSSKSVLSLLQSVVNDNKSIVNKPSIDGKSAWQGEHDKILTVSQNLTPVQRQQIRDFLENMFSNPESVKAIVLDKKQDVDEVSEVGEIKDKKDNDGNKNFP